MSFLLIESKSLQFNEFLALTFSTVYIFFPQILLQGIEICEAREQFFQISNETRKASGTLSVLIMSSCPAH